MEKARYKFLIIIIIIIIIIKNKSKNCRSQILAISSKAHHFLANS